MKECRSCLTSRDRSELRGRLCIYCIKNNGRFLVHTENQDVLDLLLHKDHRTPKRTLDKERV